MNTKYVDRSYSLENITLFNEMYITLTQARYTSW